MSLIIFKLEVGDFVLVDEIECRGSYWRRIESREYDFDDFCDKYLDRVGVIILQTSTKPVYFDVEFSDGDVETFRVNELVLAFTWGEDKFYLEKFIDA